eukprot:TRINITY_DN7690_c0_g1_i1.p3 TRINITY_DN7690_c0_g1~~TRINITY_DN7690_c0_g1_i1.p3  ORF type:complete len:108 (+),score=14.79 TRINITY_DN7690_c0_g1_i1:97-420(+)
MIRRPPRSTQGVSSAASDVYKRQHIWYRPSPFQGSGLFWSLQRLSHTSKRKVFDGRVLSICFVLKRFITNGVISRILKNLKQNSFHFFLTLVKKVVEKIKRRQDKNS